MYFLWFTVVTAGVLLTTPAAQAQSAASSPVAGLVAKFSFWQPKAEQNTQLEAGYRQHLSWHRAQQDPWTWYGWTIVSGPRYGALVDATFGHTPGDFDHAVNPAGDAVDNALHVFPFGHYQGNFTAALLPDISTPGPLRLESAYLRTYYLTPSRTADLLPVLRKWQLFVARVYPTQPLYCYQWLDGGALPQLVLLLPFPDQAGSEVVDRIMTELERLDTRHVVQKTMAETLRYRTDLSYFPNRTL
jgi:hypothetical protein